MHFGREARLYSSIDFAGGQRKQKSPAWYPVSPVMSLERMESLAAFLNDSLAVGRHSRAGLLVVYGMAKCLPCGALGLLGLLDGFKPHQEMSRLLRILPVCHLN